MIREQMIFNDELFRRLWLSDIAIPSIAKIYGTSRPAIYRASSRFGFRRRGEIVYVHPADPPDDMDGALMWSEGKYARLHRIAQERDMTFHKVQMLYHRARVNAQ